MLEKGQPITPGVYIFSKYHALFPLFCKYFVLPEVRVAN